MSKIVLQENLTPNLKRLISHEPR